jgi:hypothetical protein
MTPTPWKIRRMLNSIDESLDYAEFMRITAIQAMQIPQELVIDNTRYAFSDVYLVPALEGTMLYTIGEYIEIVEVEP